MGVAMGYSINGSGRRNREHHHFHAGIRTLRRRLAALWHSVICWRGGEVMQAGGAFDGCRQKETRHRPLGI